VYRARAISCLEQAGRKWRIVFSSPSFAGTLAAVKAGMGVTVLPRNMVPQGLEIVRQKKNWLHLEDTHISLLKHLDTNHAVNTLEKFVVEKLRP
jgi:DNA-binding transcriptional LysR family regulator